ncbi:MAG: hypothetical protein ACLSVD_04600 [Eggerthellaceae bacterium]
MIQVQHVAARVSAGCFAIVIRDYVDRGSLVDLMRALELALLWKVRIDGRKTFCAVRSAAVRFRRTATIPSRSSNVRCRCWSVIGPVGKRATAEFVLRIAWQKNGPRPEDETRFRARCFPGCRDYTMPCAIMASASFLKPAMFAPMT